MKKFKITLETVLKYKMIEEFPDAFEKKLEVGKWYKYPGHSLFATYVKEDKRRCGITTSGSWFDDADSVTDINGYVEMTQKEVETALIAEARKRGYIEYSTTEFGQQLKINSMKNLISMLAFLPEHPYSKFLSQPLEKWMFVPCDKDGNFLKEPKTWRHYTSSDQAFRSLHNEALKLCAEYGQAKSRCLFEGFDRYSGNSVTDNEISLVFTQSGGILLNRKYETHVENVGCVCEIEDLVKYNIQLTETAKKQIGL